MAYDPTSPPRLLQLGHTRQRHGGGQAAQPLVERIKPLDSLLVGQTGTL